MPQSFLLFMLIVYGVGCGVSQSLMSLGGALIGLAFLVELGILACRKPQLLAQFFRDRAGIAICIGLLLVGYSLANLFMRPWDARSPQTLGALPLQIVPAYGLLRAWLATRATPKKGGWLSVRGAEALLALTAAALGASVLRALWQLLILKQPAIGFLRNPIYLAYNLFPAFVFFGEIFVRKISFGRFVYRYSGLTALVVLVGIMAAETRMIWAASFLYLVGRLGPRIYRSAAWKGVAIAGATLVLLAGSLYFSQPRLQQKIERSFGKNDPSRVWRGVAWKYNWDLFLEHPIFGVGPEKNGIDVAKMPQYAGHWQPNVLIFAHSVYLQALAEGGLVGFILLLGYWASLGIAHPLAAVLILSESFVGITENIFNNSKAAHAFFYYVLIAFLLFPKILRNRPSKEGLS